MASSSPPRIVSLDILRGLVMTLMIAVNDLWSLKEVPQWLEHAEKGVDGMGLADVVFPAFLFIVGLSVPYSIASRRSKGESNAIICRHILQRSLALLIMGVFLVNGETIHEAATGMSGSVWNLISCVCFILLWNDYPPTFSKKWIAVVRIVAIIGLAILAIYYRNDQGGRFSSSWWGILGMIGWSYLLSAAAFTFSGTAIWPALLFWTLFMSCSMASHAGWIPRKSIPGSLIEPFGQGGLPALVMGGVVVSLICIRFQRLNRPVALIGYLSGISAALLVAGFLLRPFWGIAKLGATPSWVLICSALTIIAFAFIYWLADVRGHPKWFTLIRPAGSNTLLCYLLPYFAYALIYGVLGQWPLPDAWQTGIPGLLKSLIFSLILVQLAGRLAVAGIRLKL